MEELILREHKQGKDKKGQKKGQNTNEMALRLLSIEVKKFLEPFVLSVPWYFSFAHLPSWRVWRVDVLWSQPIKLIQVVSTSEFHEF